MGTPLKKIICAVDFSPLSDSVVQYAATMHTTGAKLIVLYVAPEELKENNEEEMLRRHLHEFSRYSDILSQHRVHALFTVQHGEPAAGIIDYAQEQNADMIVLGSHSNTAIARLLMGSTAETVMRKAPCPVVILKTPVNGKSTNESESEPNTLQENNKQSNGTT